MERSKEAGNCGVCLSSSNGGKFREKRGGLGSLGKKQDPIFKITKAKRDGTWIKQ
jgi:hypothetical protein